MRCAGSAKPSPASGDTVAGELDILRAAVGRAFPTPAPGADDPVAWFSHRRGGPLDGFLWSKQREISRALQHNRYVAVPACHGPGKSFLAAGLAAWWIDTHKPGTAFVVTTAPTTPQVKAILWREIGRAHADAGLAGRVTLDARWMLPIGGRDELVAFGRKPAVATRRRAGEPVLEVAAFQGIHAEHVLVILDEAAGIPRALFDAADTLATSAGSKVLAIGNPDDPQSGFADACKPGSGWTVVPISAFDTPAFTGEAVPPELAALLVSQQWVDERRTRWGEGSPLWQAKVLGLFPDASDDTLISASWIAQAQQRDLDGLDPGTWGLDVATSGTDETCLYRQRGGVVRLAHSARKDETMETTGKVIRVLRAGKGAGSKLPIAVDKIGVGSGVWSRLREQRFDARGFDSSAKPSTPQAQLEFVNRRAEAWWTVRELFREGLVDLDPDDDRLAAQLGSIKYSTRSDGRILIESKDDMRARGMPSPDRADAVMMALAGCGPKRPKPPPAGTVTSSGDTLTGDLLTRDM